ncbi:hypothetical protein BJV74DRAFT_781398 [Russula compacta]|nr:hypothetical protein BJV74DRAFT_781398 [Russula compacta]
MDLDDGLTCPVCLRWFKTKRGCTSHLKNARSCLWYRYGKLANLEPLGPLDLNGEGGEVGIQDMVGEDEGILRKGYGEEADPEDILGGIEDDDNIFHFIPIPVLPAPEAPDQNYRALDDEDDSRVEDSYVGAGKVIKMNETLHEKWRKTFGSGKDRDGDVEMGNPTPPENSFHPFTSELDWRIANWVIKDSLGNNAFDRFLAIPGVKDKLGLSFSNTHAVHELVDKIPDCAGDWTSKYLSFKDHPEEKHIICYRSVVEAIQCLWGDPALSKHLVYVLKKVFSDDTRSNQIYSEMWTGSWWHVVQVRHLQYHIYLSHFYARIIFHLAG